MSQIIRCRNCRGSKSIMGMGGIQHKCKFCSGIGYQTVVSEQDTDDFLEKNPRKKRKSKDIEEQANV